MELPLIIPPEGYREAGKLDIDNDPKQSVKINMTSLMLMLPFAVVLLIMYVNGGAVSFDMDITHWVLMFGILAAAIIVHELLHGLMFILLSPDHKAKMGVHMMMPYAGNPGAFLSRGRYAAVKLLPAVIVTAAFALSLTRLTGTAFYVSYMAMALHLGSATGDFIAVKMLFALKPDALASDDGIVVRFYSK